MYKKADYRKQLARPPVQSIFSSSNYKQGHSRSLGYYLTVRT